MKRRDFLKSLSVVAAGVMLPGSTEAESFKGFRIKAGDRVFPVHTSLRTAQHMANRIYLPQFCECRYGSLGEQLKAEAGKPMVVYVMVVFPRGSGDPAECHIQSIPVANPRKLVRSGSLKAGGIPQRVARPA